LAKNTSIMARGPQRRRRSNGGGITIHDVARRAGVSTATVSRAIAMPDRVSVETRRQVAKAIAETGYTPNASARNLRVRSTRMVLALVPGMTNTFFTPILNAIEDVLSAAGYGLIIGDTRNTKTREAHYARLIRAGQVDGVILLTGHMPRENEHAGIEDAAVTTLVCVDIPRSGLPVFHTANRAAAREMVAYLIGKGHRRIAHITGPKGNIESSERIAGYKEALKAAGIPFDPGLVWQGAFLQGTGSSTSRAFLAQADRPTAVFAANDEAAVDFIRSVEREGLSVPDDVSVAGFDDIEYLQYFEPGLTTMRQPRSELGRLAATDLLKRMQRDGADIPPARVQLPCELIERGSVRDVSVPARRKATVRA
jgi:LacI family transcriptional regulator, repressor for deo operon, udp, cdd, tsx, nupC, and nupG